MSQNQQVNLKLKGLYTAPNDFTGVPNGALEVADDCVIDYESLVESRRGFDYLAGELPNTDDRINRFTNYQSKKIAHWNTDKLGYYDSGTWTAYSGTYSHPDSTLARTRFFEGNQNLYISTSAGVKKLDTYNGTPTAAGVPKGLDLQLSLSGASGFFGTNTVATVTGHTTNGSAILTLLSDVSLIAIGQYVQGSGITSGTTVTAITSSATVLITTGDIAAGSTSMTNVPTNAGLATGQLITGTGIPAGTRITALAGAGPYTVTMSQSAIATAATTPVTFASDPQITLSANATATATVSLVFSSGSQVGYRLIFGIRDANNNLNYGAPTQFASITNTTGATTNVVATATLPSGITTAHFYQLYRSPQTAGASVTPLDDEQLVYEGNPNNTDISNGYVQITDITPDSLRGLYLYTAISEEGITQQNEPPPYCKDFCSFNSYGLYANTKTKQRKKLTVLAVGGSNGIAANDTLVINGVTFTAKTSETIASGFFQIYTSGTPAQNIFDTTNSLIRVINRYASNTTVYAYLLSGPTDNPGQILIEERGVGGSSFAITASAHGSAYSPTLPTSGTTVSSTQDVYKNGIFISKAGQYEAVPLTNLVFAGSASKEILRVIPLRDYVIILKQDGIFRLTGTSLSTFAVSPFDLTTKLLAPDSAVSLSNEVWGLYDQGVCSVSDTGVNVRSRPIETTIRALAATAPASIRQVTFAVGYETDHRYILSLPITDADTYTRQQYVFQTFTDAWTKWTRSASAGYVDLEEDKLYLANGTSNTVSGERKTKSYRDYVDEGFDVTIVSSSGKSVVLSSVTDIVVGDILYKSSTVASLITAIDIPTSTVTVENLLTWGTGAASVLTAITNVVQWKPVVAGNPAYVRQYSEGAAIFKRTQFNNGTISFYSDVSLSFEDVPLTGFGIGSWGLFPFGTLPWGGVVRPRSVRFLVPQNKQMASQLSPKLSIRNGYSNWALEGISISYNPVSQEVL